jgi:spermidine/putrescine transport system substrate-binding protein
MLDTHPQERPATQPRAAEQLTRRELLARGAAVALLPGLAAGLLASCGETATASAAEAPRGTAVLQGTVDGLGPDELALFHSQFPAMQVVAQTYMPSEPAYERQLLENDAGAYDFVIGDLVTLGGLTAVGVAGLPDWSAIPNYRYVDKIFRRVCPGAVPNDYGFSVIAYRRDIVSEPLTSWADFWRLSAGYRGRVSVAADQRPTLGVALQSLGYSANSAEPVELQRAVQALRQLKANLIQPPWPSGDLLAADLAAGKVVLAQCSNHDAAIAQAADDKVVALIAHEGTVANMHCFVPLKGAGHPRIVSDFLNFHLEPRTYARFVTATGCPWVESAAAPYIGAALRGKAILRPTGAQLAKFEWLRYLGAAEQAWHAAWQDVLSA